ncbi:MAG: hypothetical protein WAT39_02735 [Planctomycetota bacterium]
MLRVVGRTPRLLPWLAVACGSACSAVTTMLPDRAPSPHPPRPVAGTPFVDCKGIVHCHGRLSHDSEGTLDEIAAACRDARIDFVVMTDHQTETSIRDGTRGMVGDTLFLVGAEVRSPKGTLLCFPLVRPLRRFQHPALLAKEAREQGGLAFVCHGERWQLPFAGHGLAGAEIVNLHAGAMTAGALGTLATGLFLPMRSLCERLCVRDDRVFAAFDDALAASHAFTPIGGNDAHANVRLFGPLGGTLGTYREIFLTLSTHVLAERLDEAALVAAFAAGRSYVAFDVFGDGTGFDFRAVEAAGTVHVGGDSVAAAPGLELCVTTPAIGRIRLLRDGVEVAARTACTLRLTSPPTGVYRVEVTTPAGAPWLFSSSIRVTAPGLVAGGRR